MLEMVREYASEQLAARGEAEQRRERHAAYFSDLAAAADFSGDAHARWLVRLEAEHSNLRAALAHLLQREEIDAAFDCAASLRPLWLDHGHFDEAARWFAQLLERESQASPRSKAALLHGARWFVPEGAERRRRLEECVALHREIDQPLGLVEALNRQADEIFDPFIGGDSEA